VVRLVHRGDLVAYLASHEETLRALDAVRAEAGVIGDDNKGAEDLSLKAIADEKSEVVRLVRSTLRDALKLGASDIHLETVAAGLSIKFRIDGILIQIKQIDDRVRPDLLLRACLPRPKFPAFRATRLAPSFATRPRPPSEPAGRLASVFALRRIATLARCRRGVTATKATSHGIELRSRVL
jgi:hypothetical protein